MFIRHAGPLAPAALVLSALSAPADAQTPTAVDSLVVTAHRDPEDPPVVAEGRARLSQTPGAGAVFSR